MKANAVAICLKRWQIPSIKHKISKERGIIIERPTPHNFKDQKSFHAAVLIT